MVMIEQGRKRFVGWADVALLGVAVVWGASYPMAKTALVYAPVLIVILCRFALTGILMGAAAWRELALLKRADAMRGGVLGAILFLTMTAEISGVSLSGATNAALIVSLSTLFTPLFDYGLSHRLPPVGVTIGAVAGCIGVALLVGGASSYSAGDALLLLAAGLRAAMVVATKRLMSKSRMSSKALTAVQATTVAALTVAFLLVTRQPIAVARYLPATFWENIAFLSLFCTVAAFYVQNAMVRRTSPTRVALLMGTEPLFGCALAHFLIDEPIGVRTALGAALIVGGTFLGIKAEQQARA